MQISSEISRVLPYLQEDAYPSALETFCGSFYRHVLYHMGLYVQMTFYGQCCPHYH